MKWFWACLLLACIAAPLSADTLVLKDGTKLDGRVIEQGDSYWIRLSDGGSKTVAKSGVKDWIKGDSAAKPASPTTPGSTTPTTPGSASTPAKPQLSYAATKGKADQLEVPLAAAAMWQNWIDANPAAPELAQAKAELDVWQKRVDAKAEKIAGKWVGGEERTKLLEKVAQLSREADQAMAAHQTLQAMAKLEEIVKIYPNHFAANFWLGFLHLQADKFDKASVNLETALKIRPESPEALTNYAIALNLRKQYEKSVLMAYKAAQIRDSREIVQNLVNAISYAPPAMRQNNSKVKPAMEAGMLLASKYGISKPEGWTFIGLRPASADPAAQGGAKAKPGEDAESDEERTPGVIGNGSGVLISADGLILTNKHVAQVGDLLLVKLPDGTKKPAERIVIDDEQDLALIRIKSDKPLPFLELAEADEPGPGAECTALGFPLAAMMRLTLQVTPGTVSSVIGADTANVVVTCKVNPGNSGGPLVDRFGNIIGIVTQKTFGGDFIESYGKAISAGRIRTFLKKHQEKHKTTVANAKDAPTALNTEGIYKKVAPASVCIIMVRSGEKTPEPK